MRIFLFFKSVRAAKKIWRIMNTSRASIWGENKLGYLTLDIICSSYLTVFLKLRSRKTIDFSEQIMSTDKYPSIFLPQMEAIVYVYPQPPNSMGNLSTSIFEKWTRNQRWFCMLVCRCSVTVIHRVTAIYRAIIYRFYCILLNHSNVLSLYYLLTT